MTATEPRARIVVGVDGSGGAAAALRWALGEARLRDASVEALCVWHFPIPVGLPYADAQVMASVDLETAARSTLAVEVDKATADDDLPPAVEQRVIFGNAAEQLLEAAKGADLLVVGSRGRGGFAGLLLGSVSRACAEHASCPVVIVPHSNDD
jgi:nucleotide-binding universal stress UspA family protein